MHTPYRGLFNPGHNIGGADMMIVEKYNHRLAVERIKPKSLNHEAHFRQPPQKTIQSKEFVKSSVFKGSQFDFHTTVLFRRLNSQQQSKAKLLYEPILNIPKDKHYQEKTLSQLMQKFNKESDPYGYKESKYRSKLANKGKSYASDLVKYSVNEKLSFQKFDELSLSSDTLDRRYSLQEIIKTIQLEFKLNLDSMAKLFNHIQKSMPLSLTEIQQLYYHINA